MTYTITSSLVNRFIALVTLLLLAFNALAQLSVTQFDSVYSINFDQTVPGVINGQFKANGFSPTPGNGQMDSDAWEVWTGVWWVPYGFTTDGSVAVVERGTSPGGESSAGVWAYEVATGNYALGARPGQQDFSGSPIGYYRLRIVNHTGDTIRKMSLDYDFYYYDDNSIQTKVDVKGSSMSTPRFTMELSDSSRLNVPASNSWIANSHSEHSRIYVLPNDSAYVRFEILPDWNQHSGEVAIDNIVLTFDDVDYVHDMGWEPEDPSGISTSAERARVKAGVATFSAASNLEVLEVESGAAVDALLPLTIADSVVLNASGNSEYAQFKGSVNGDVVFKRYCGSNLPGRWFNVAFPISAPLSEIRLNNGGVLQSLAEVGQNASKVNIYYFDPTIDNGMGEGSWLPAPNLNSLASTTGYAVYLGDSSFGTLPVTMSLRGNLPGTTVAKNVYHDNMGWNFINNPFACGLNWDAIVSSNATLDNTYYVFRDDADSVWVGYNSTASTPTSTRSLITPLITGDQYIAPGQSVFVKANATTSITLGGVQRSVNFKPTLQKKNTQYPGIYLQAVTADSTTDFTYIGFHPAASDGLDPSLDGEKRLNSAHRVPNIYTEVASRPNMFNFVNDQFTIKSLDVYLETKKSGSVSIGMAEAALPAEWTVKLKDGHGNLHDLRATAVNLSAQKGLNKYQLLINSSGAVNIGEFASHKISAFVQDGHLHLEHPDFGTEYVDLLLYDLRGRLMKKGQLGNAGASTHSVSELPRGVYILLLEQNSRRIFAQKIQL